jgi:hypothetical protein
VTAECESFARLLVHRVGEHVVTSKARQHAKLAGNAAKTIADFVYDTFEYQLSAGTIVELKTSSSVERLEP